MRRTIEVTLVCAAMVACEAPSDLEVSYAESAEAAGEAVKDDGPSVSEACPGTRFIARSDNQDCPVSQHQSWRTSSLFSSDDSGEQVQVDRGMGDLCLYTYRGRGKPTLRAIRGLRQSLGGRVSGLAPDCQVVAPLASGLTDYTWRPMRQAFLRAVNFPTELAGDPSTVRVAVVDTSPRSYDRGQANDGNSGHGLTVGRIIRGLTCAPDGAPAGACVGFVSSHLALPRLFDGSVDRAGGGYYGHFGELAISINAATNAWIDHRDNPPPGEPPHHRLVINLSVGWDGVYGGAYDPSRPVEGQLSAPILAVHRAIERAACHGALIIAAAGNDTGGLPVPTGPMYPGGWERAPAPNAAACDDYDVRRGDEPVPAPSAAYRPLLYSVGGVDGRDVPLASTRRQGRPRLAAPAFQAVMGYNDGGSVGITDVMTGSSAATAVASAAAALVWGYDQNLHGADVMARVYRTGVSLNPDRADYCQGPSCAARFPVRRLSMCRSLLATCASAGAACPAPAAFRCPPVVAAHAGDNAKITNAMMKLDIEPATLPETDYSADPAHDLGAVPECGPSLDVSSAFASPPGTWGVCPERQAFASVAAPWISPQPGVDPCPECLAIPYDDGVTQYFKLHLAIDTSYAGATLEDATLEIDGYASVDLASYGVSGVTGGDVLTVSGVACKTCTLGTPSVVKLAFGTVSGGKSGGAVSSQLLIK